jgi:hypothetical protein
VNGTGSCPIMGFGINSVEHLSSARDLVLNITCMISETLKLQKF